MAGKKSFIRSNRAQVADDEVQVHRAFIVVADDRRPYLAMIPPRQRRVIGPRPARSSYRRVGKTFADQAAGRRRHVAEHAARGAVHPSPASMTDFLPVIDRFSAGFRR
jgi:hypothetical protein